MPLNKSSTLNLRPIPHLHHPRPASRQQERAALWPHDYRHDCGSFNANQPVSHFAMPERGICVHEIFLSHMSDCVADRAAGDVGERGL